jgi:hypothetical protein
MIFNLNNDIISKCRKEKEMNEIGAISSYALAMQKLQLNIIKQAAETQQQLIETLLDPERVVNTTSDKGSKIDINI